MTFLPIAFSALNGKCTGKDGICVSTSNCTKYNGISYSEKYPNDGDNIKCCNSISPTANGKTGKCMFSTQCSGTTYSGLCPGGNDINTVLLFLKLIFQSHLHLFLQIILKNW